MRLVYSEKNCFFYIIHDSVWLQYKSFIEYNLLEQHVVHVPTLRSASIKVCPNQQNLLKMNRLTTVTPQAWLNFSQITSHSRFTMIKKKERRKENHRFIFKNKLI